MRVPVSIVVRMNSASNMIAKWYQYARSVFIPGSPLKMRAMPDRERDAAPRARGDDLARGAREGRRAPSREIPRRAKSASSSDVARGARGSTWKPSAASAGFERARTFEAGTTGYAAPDATELPRPVGPESEELHVVRVERGERPPELVRRSREPDAVRRLGGDDRDLRVGVDRDVVFGGQHARGDERGDPDEPLHQHRAVADGPAVASRGRPSSASCRSRRARGSR